MKNLFKIIKKNKQATTPFFSLLNSNNVFVFRIVIWHIFCIYNFLIICVCVCLASNLREYKVYVCCVVYKDMYMYVEILRVCVECVLGEENCCSISNKFSRDLNI